MTTYTTHPENGIGRTPLGVCELSTWTALELLASERRRYVVESFSSVSELNLDRLAAHVATREFDVPSHELTDKQVDVTRLRLRHGDLPRLETHDVVSVEDDPDGDEIFVRAGSNLDGLDVVRYRVDTMCGREW